MPVEAVPLFRPEVIRPHVTGFEVPGYATTARSRLTGWVELLESTKGKGQKETELLPDYLTDVFHRILGYRGPAEQENSRYSLSREKLVEVDGKYADAVLGAFAADEDRLVVALEGKGPRDPLDRPFGGRRMSAVDQAYRYAINLPCDWILVTNLREIRLYHKGSTQRTFERFRLEELASDDFQFRKFVFLLGAERVVPGVGRSHLYDMLEASDRADDRLTQEFYKAYAGIRHDLLNALLESNPDVEPRDVLAAAQRLLDRVLFVAFAEDRSLLPPDTLADAYKHRDPYNPRPVWDNFRGLFRAIDQGNEKLSIPKYNGGLFAEHELLDRQLEVSDEACHLLKRLGDYNYGYPGDGQDGEDEHLVDVEILGHIFEQSIEDLEAIRSEIEGGGEVSRATSKRKREGAFYTPSYVTRYIVTEALGPVIGERFERLRAEHQDQITGSAVSVLEDPQAYDLDQLNNPQRDALIAFWEAWIEELKTVRVLDPACGSGAFLIEVFDVLYARYQESVGHLTDLRRGGFVGSLLDPDRTILENNVYGVDLNEEAVEIARLSIWIKTAARGKVLTDLNHNVQVGNSIVDDPELDPRAFDWWGAFPEVEKQGGFDVVVGNPPYVRAEMLTNVKPHLQERYDAYHGSADLYVYFYELGVRLLRPGGRMSYIVTNKWLKAGYAKPLRAFFGEQTWVEEIVDLGHAKEIFQDADVFPSILRVQRPSPELEAPKDTRASVIPRDDLRIHDFGLQLRSSQFSVARERLAGDAWSLERPALQALMQKIQKAGNALDEYLPRKPKYGLKTGYNKAFLITDEEKKRLVASDPASSQVLGRYLRGQDIKRWDPEWADLWILLLKSSGDHHWPWSDTEDEAAAEAVFAQSYPAVYQHLKGHEDRLRGRSDQGRFWWELRSCDYYELFAGPKIIHTDITWRAEFALVREPFYLVNTAYMWPTDDLYLLGVVNSPLMWSYMWRNAQHGKDEALRMIYSFVSKIPVAEPSAGQRDGVETRVRELLTISQRRVKGRDSLLDWLQVEFGVEKPGQKLSAPHEIDPETFVAEVKKRRAGRSTVTTAELRRLREEFETVTEPLRRDAERGLELETQVSDLVNQAYGLTPEEVKLLWQTAPPRMPKVKNN